MATTAVTGGPYLPDWCRGYPAVVELAGRDLAYRCDLWQAKTATMRQLLLALAHHVREGQR